MAARRQPSTTSLSKFVRSEPGPANRSLDFCNAFWGSGDGGVDVLFARMRGGTRTMEELRNFFKERALIEEDYAKRMSKLAKNHLGKDEIGELRNSLDTVRLETDKQAQFHLQLAQQIRNEMDTPSNAFMAKQAQHKKSFQAAIEKDFRAKQTQESYVNKAREKYEADCLRINSYTAQSSLVQGKDLEKIQLKLERAQQTVQANERDFANFAKALQDTVGKWELAWKTFCDSCQDLEEERLEFMKDTLWAYANAVSTMCVSDDEACEHMRLALEQMESDKDMENFVRDYGTGNAIPDPPAFVNYTSADAPPSNSRPQTRPAHFTRATQRALRPPISASPLPQDDEPMVNGAGIGAIGGGAPLQSGAQPQRAEQNLSRQPTQSRARQAVQQQLAAAAASNAANGASSSRSNSAAASRATPVDPHAEPIDPRAQTFIKVGNNAYQVDLTNDPQEQGSSSRASASSVPPVGINGQDPLVRSMQEFKTQASSSGSANSRQGTANAAAAAGPSSLSLPGPSGSTSSGIAQPQASNRDYRNSAEDVVGAHPSVSRPSSPQPPTPTFMQPPRQIPNSSMPVEGVLADYHQSLPGERKSISRPSSRAGSFSGGPQHSHSQSQQMHGQNLARPVSREGHPGIGAHGRSTSPQPISRSASPVGNRDSFNRPGPGSIINQPGNQGSMRAISPGPNRVGIALDPNGAVVHDSMLDMYNQQQAPQRRLSYGGPPVNQVPVSVTAYGAAAPPPAGFPPPAPGQPGYDTRVQQSYSPAPVQYMPSQQPQYAQPQQVQQPVYQDPRYVQPQQQPYDYRAPSPAPQQPPTGQTTEDGAGILFYVKGLYDYTATIEEEFDFQAGDIIAVTATPEDGWWSGWLLDEARRQPGRHIFPSNFVCLLE